MRLCRNPEKVNSRVGPGGIYAGADDAATFVLRALAIAQRNGLDNDMSASAQRTVFDHIPKTGGTSVAAVIAAAMGERTKLAHSTYPHHVIIAAAGPRRFINGHIWFYAGESLAPDWYYATLLRDPIDRFLSQYHFQRQHREQVLSGTMDEFVTVKAVRHDLATYLEDTNGEITRSYTNVQACHFAARLCERPHELSDHQLLEAAIASLEGYDLVGVYDDIQGFSNSYCCALGQPEQALPRLNATLHRGFEDELPRELRNRLRRVNAVDFALLDWAHRRFSRRGADCGIVAKTSDRRVAAVSGANFGTREIEILEADCSGSENYSTPVRKSVRLTCRSKIVERDLTVGVAIRDGYGTAMAEASSRTLKIPIVISAPQDFFLHIGFNAAFPAGDYTVTFALHKGLTHLDRCYHWVDSAVQFSVEPGQNGDVGIDFSIAIEEAFSHVGHQPDGMIRKIARKFLDLLFLLTRRSNT
jgi:hypothetical protein